MKWSDDARTQANARCLQRTLWMLENDLTASLFFMASSAGSSSWDTHQHNLRRQTEQANCLFGVLQRFLTALSERSNAHGNLLRAPNKTVARNPGSKEGGVSGLLAVTDD